MSRCQKSDLVPGWPTLPSVDWDRSHPFPSPSAEPASEVFPRAAEPWPGCGPAPPLTGRGSWTCPLWSLRLSQLQAVSGCWEALPPSVCLARGTCELPALLACGLPTGHTAPWPSTTASWAALREPLTARGAGCLREELTVENLAWANCAGNTMSSTDLRADR